MTSCVVAAWLAVTIFASLPPVDGARVRADGGAWQNHAAEVPSPAPRQQVKASLIKMHDPPAGAVAASPGAPGPAPFSTARPPFPPLKPAPPPGEYGYNYFHHGFDWEMGTCQSREKQSPINIDTHLETPSTRVLEYHYRDLKNVNLTLRAHGGMMYIDFRGMEVGGLAYNRAWYPLVRIDFHVQAEHTIKGERHPMEIQMVHRRLDDPNWVVIVAILVWSEVTPDPPHHADDEDPPKFFPPDPAEVDHNWQLQHFVKDPPPMAEDNYTTIEIPEDDEHPLDFNLWVNNPDVQDSNTFIEYPGSLTAPPCTEQATWFVRRKLMLASNSQVKVFSDAVYMYNYMKGNNRGVMPANNRGLTVWRFERNEDPHLGLKPPLPLGPNPRNDAEYSAFTLANMARDQSQQAIEYLGDVAKRLRVASDRAAVAWTVAPTRPPPPPKKIDAYDEAVKSLREGITQMARSTKDFADRQFRVAAANVHGDALKEANVASEMVAGGMMPR
eukprot:gnl/TRDRNA2_/TRDRNA2_181683_c0_seq1.p2 gnl/TRDRNA2_/TRDRNA2_181683_c0~~gnl/TRDRNA2_/TRDRNA2_181683_c0_seq1.p2  ORF type:complete len:534 (-),score=99.96 gnl/TRDRNA2_/TRDRNA2_181683_c0_seq1:149-1645(-)